MFLDLNGNLPSRFIHLRRVLIELHSGKPSDPLSYVRRSLRAGRGESLIPDVFFAHSYFRLPTWSRWQLHQQGCIALS
jgi:hypothetical protein